MGKSLKCPGFRFKPTDVELAMYYLKKKLLGKKLHPEVIADINIYYFSPWDLPAKSILSGDLEWYFFCSQSKKYSSGSRTNRATESGYWKGTGKDREVKYNGRTVAVIKTLIFYLGHPPKGTRTNWVMHEYRMKDEDLANQGVAQEAYVICKVFEKRGAGPQNGAQYGAPFEEEEWEDDDDDDETSSGVNTLLVNPNNNASCSTSTGVMNITLTELDLYTVTSSAVNCLFGDTKTLDPNYASSSSPSTITSLENKRLTNVPVKGTQQFTVTESQQISNSQQYSQGTGLQQRWSRAVADRRQQVSNRKEILGIPVLMVGDVSAIQPFRVAMPRWKLEIEVAVDGINPNFNFRLRGPKQGLIICYRRAGPDELCRYMEIF